MAFSSSKKSDVGFKFAAGIMSTDASNIAWYAERYGLSPNQLSNDIWINTIPAALTLAEADTNATNESFIIKHSSSSPVKLVREDGNAGGNTQGHNDTLWMARDNSGNRMRNFINPNNHLDSTGAISLGYTIRLYEDNGSGSIDVSSQINTTDADWFFYYKEGILIFDTDSTPNSNGFQTQGNKQLWAVVYQYTGLTLAPNNTPSDGQVISYDQSNDQLTWSAGGSGGITSVDWDDLNASNTPTDGQVLSYDQTNDQLEWVTNTSSGNAVITTHNYVGNQYNSNGYIHWDGSRFRLRGYSQIGNNLAFTDLKDVSDGYNHWNEDSSNDVDKQVVINDPSVNKFSAAPYYDFLNSQTTVSDISDFQAGVSANTTVTSNTSSISTNTSDIATNTGDIATNTSGISTINTEISNLALGDTNVQSDFNTIDVNDDAFIKNKPTLEQLLNWIQPQAGYSIDASNIPNATDSDLTVNGDLTITGTSIKDSNNASFLNILNNNTLLEFTQDSQVSGNLHVTGAITGADLIDESNLDVSNTATNGYVLSADSLVTGGLKWVQQTAAGYSPNGSLGEIQFAGASTSDGFQSRPELKWDSTSNILFINGTIGGTVSLASGVTGVTHIASDSTNKVATTSFVQNAISNVGGVPTLADGEVILGTPTGNTNLNLATAINQAGDLTSSGNIHADGLLSADGAFKLNSGDIQDSAGNTVIGFGDGQITTINSSYTYPIAANYVSQYDTSTYYHRSTVLETTSLDVSYDVDFGVAGSGAEVRFRSDYIYGGMVFDPMFNGTLFMGNTSLKIGTGAGYNPTTFKISANANSLFISPENSSADSLYIGGVVSGDVHTTMNGDLTLSSGNDILLSGGGTVDGRVLSTDGAKLDLLSLTQSIDLDSLSTSVSNNTVKPDLTQPNAGTVDPTNYTDTTYSVQDGELSQNNLTNSLKANYDAAYDHSLLPHAPENAEQNVQSNWTEVDTNSDAYIQNKPGFNQLIDWTIDQSTTSLIDPNNLEKANKVGVTQDQISTYDRYLLFGSHVGAGNPGAGVTVKGSTLLKYNPSTRELTSSYFVGELTGNSSTATEIASITNSDIVQKDLAQNITNKIFDNSNTFPSLDNFSGTALNATNALNSSNVSLDVDESSLSELYINFTPSQTGFDSLYTNSELKYLPDENKLIVKKLSVGTDGIDSAGGISTTGEFSGTLSSSMLATTQTAGDNSTKVATTAYVDSAVSTGSGGGGLTIGGSDTEIQFNNNGSLDGDSSFYFSSSNNRIHAEQLWLSSTTTSSFAFACPGRAYFYGAQTQFDNELTASGNVKLTALSGPTQTHVVGIDTTTGKLYSQPASSGGGVPATPDTSIQFNNSGSFGGDTNLTYNSSTNTISGVNFTFSGSDVNLSGLTPTTQTNVVGIDTSTGQLYSQPAASGSGGSNPGGTVSNGVHSIQYINSAGGTSFVGETIPSFLGWEDSATKLHTQKLKINGDTLEFPNIPSSAQSYVLGINNSGRVYKQLATTPAAQGPDSAIQFRASGTGVVTGSADLQYEGGTSNRKLVAVGAQQFGDPANVASGGYASAFGTNTRATSQDSFAIGEDAIASGRQSFAGGFDCTASGAASFAVGALTTASGERAICFGANSTASGIDAVVMGFNHSALGDRTLTIGYENVNRSSNGFVMGQTNTLKNMYTNSDTGAGTGSFVGGYNNIVEVNDSIVFGSDCDAGVTSAGGNNSKNQFLFGLGLGVPKNNAGDAAGQSQTVVGRYNYDQNQAHLLFSVGNGTGPLLADRSTAFVVTGNGQVGVKKTLPSYDLHLGTNSAAKPSSNTWTISSDVRVKENIQEYTKGLSEIVQLEPKTYDYNGKAGFDSSIKGNIGIIAQDVEDIFPETISTYNAKLNEGDEEETELYNFDSHALTFALINSVKELNEEIKSLKQEIQQLKNS